MIFFWPRVEVFVRSLPPHSLVGDLGIRWGGRRGVEAFVRSLPPHSLVRDLSVLFFMFYWGERRAGPT